MIFGHLPHDESTLNEIVSALAFRKDEEILSLDIYSYSVSIVLTLDAAVKEHIQENTYKE